MRCLVALVALFLGLLPAAAQEAGVRRYFDDWLAVCRADGYCSAVSYMNPNPGGGRVADYWFRVGRHAQGIYWEMSFTPIVHEAVRDSEFTITVDGAPETFVGVEQIAPYGAVNDYYLLGSKAQQVMDRLMPGEVLDVEFRDNADELRKASFSLKGLTAALIWIDETQGRLGSERVAEAPPEGLAPEFRQPILDLFTVQLVTLHNDTSGCSNRIDPETYARIGSAALDQYHTLYLVPCEDFAYNFISALYVATDEGLVPAILPQSDARGGSFGNTIYSADWDETSGELLSHYKGGNGNCGSEGRWRWTGEAFELIELRARETCDNTTVEWPVVAGGKAN